MSKHIGEVKEYMHELDKRRKAYTRDLPRRLAKVYQGEKGENGKPDYFRDSSFLYIRSYHGDTGVRPFSGIQFWKSPDINISPINSIGPFTTELEGGKSYNISCRLHNRGDLMIPYPKVEFFLTTPALGMNTVAAELLGLTQLPALLLPASNGEANFTYNVPAEQAGHKCLFARTYSLSPVDKPFDLVSLNPRTDRHVAQKNLNFVPATTPYFFNLIHQPNALETITFQPMTKDAVMAVQHPALLDLKVKSLRRRKQLRKINVQLLEEPAGRFSMKRDKDSWSIRTVGKGASFEEQAEMHRRTEDIIRAVHAGKASFADYRKALRPVREMNRQAVVTRMGITIPDLGLEQGEAAGFEIVNTNKITGEIKGGITVIVV